VYLAYSLFYILTHLLGLHLLGLHLLGLHLLGLHLLGLHLLGLHLLGLHFGLAADRLAATPPTCSDNP
jgi:hypothetical protein